MQKFAEGSSLITDIGPVAKGEKTAIFWLGTLPSLSRQLDVAGVSFVPNTAVQVPDPSNPSRSQLRPYVGSLVRLTRTQLENLVEKLPRTVIRFYSPNENEDTRLRDMTGKPPRRAAQIHVIRTPEEIAERKRNGLNVRNYKPAQGDEPAADHVYLVACEDQVNGNRGAVFPPPLSETGIEWPHDSEAPPAEEPVDSAPSQGPSDLDLFE